MCKKTIYYRSFTEDVVESSDQDFRLPEHYNWENNSIKGRILEWVLYPLFSAFSFIYCPIFLHEKVIGRKKLKEIGKENCFIYANHTQMVGDAFTPTYILRGKRVAVPISPANLGIPVLGPMLRYLGGLPIPQDARQLKSFSREFNKRIDRKHTGVIYPEAHVWPYYTGIRPFDTASFTYPVMGGKPVFAMTSTYQKRNFGIKPAITIFIDGPFYPDSSLPRKEQKNKLHDQVMAAMIERSKESSYEYYEYTLQRG